MKILITGAAGFIGFHAVKHFAEKGNQVVGIDNLNNYYDVKLKYARLHEAGIEKGFIRNHQPLQSSVYSSYRFFKADIQDKGFIDELFAREKFDVVCHLAAQAGVRNSIQNPYEYVNTNILGFLNILEACRHFPVKHLVYASSSSIYGLNNHIPYRKTDQVDEPVSLYAASKKSNELMAHTYSKLYRIPTTGVRFFTVYGPWGRPDMAPFLFMDAIVNQKPIRVFNHGNLSRDFTYIDDIIQGLSSIADHAPETEIPYKIYNIGRGKPVRLMDFISVIEEVTGKTAITKMVGMQKGDVFQTFADTSALVKDVHYKPTVSIHEGIWKLYQWYVHFVIRPEMKNQFARV
ncbi:MAG: NAD-dependent epimerase/dehydratase family protein [Prolixibacteraceae bacterium]